MASISSKTKGITFGSIGIILVIMATIAIIIGNPLSRFPIWRFALFPLLVGIVLMIIGFSFGLSSIKNIKLKKKILLRSGIVLFLIGIIGLIIGVITIAVMSSLILSQFALVMATISGVLLFIGLAFMFISALI